MPRTNFGPELTDEQMEEREKSIFKGIGDDAMEAPHQQRMTPQVSENAAVEQVDLHFVGLVDTEETVDAKMFHELGESLDVHALGKHDITEIFSPARFTRESQQFWIEAWLCYRFGNKQRKRRKMGLDEQDTSEGFGSHSESRRSLFVDRITTF